MFEYYHDMASWLLFASANPTLAAQVRALFFQYGPGLGYLATVRADGGPRVHPVSPVIFNDGLYCFIIDSPKQRDLARDGRYALHAFPAEDADDEAYVAGRAEPVADPELVRRLAFSMRAEPRASWQLYEFTVDVAMVIRRRAAPTSPTGNGPTAREIWRDPVVR
jgi:hypothetical protein